MNFLDEKKFLQAREKIIAGVNLLFESLSPKLKSSPPASLTPESTLDDIRRICAQTVQADPSKSPKIQELISSLGAEHLSDVPPEKVQSLIEGLIALK